MANNLGLLLVVVAAVNGSFAQYQDLVDSQSGNWSQLEYVKSSIIPNFPEFDSRNLSCAEDNIKLNDETIGIHQEDTWENCGRSCQEISACKAWSFYSEEKKCSLKKENRLREYSPSYTSGFKLCPKYNLSNTYSISNRDIIVDDAEDVYIIENTVDLNKVFKKIYPRTRKLTILTDTLVLYKSEDVHQLDELSITARQIIIPSVLGTNLRFHSRTREGVKVDIVSDRTLVTSTLKIEALGINGEEGVKGKDGKSGRVGVRREEVNGGRGLLASRSYYCRDYDLNGDQGQTGEDGGKGTDGGNSGYILYSSRLIDGSIVVIKKGGQGGKGGEGGEGGTGGTPDFCWTMGFMFQWYKMKGNRGATGAKGNTGLNGLHGKASINPPIKNKYSVALKIIHGREKLQEKINKGHVENNLPIRNMDTSYSLQKLNELKNSAKQLQTRTTIHQLGIMHRNIAYSKKQIVEKYVVSFKGKLDNLERKKQAIVSAISEQIERAASSKEAALKNKLRKERQKMIGDIMAAIFSGLGGVTGIVSGFTSAVSKMDRFSAVATLATTAASTYASTIESIQGAKRQTSSIGCNSNLLLEINSFYEKYRKESETAFSGERQDFNSKYTSFLAGKAQRDLKLLLHCVLATNSWYQFETDPAAQKLSNTIDEYFDASITQMHIFGELISLEDEQNILSYEINEFSMFSTVYDIKMWKPLAYIKIEKQFVDLLTGLVEAYEFKYLARFPDFENEVKGILLKSPNLDSRLEEWNELTRKIENWKSGKENSMLSNGIAWQEDIVHLKIIDEILFNQLENDIAFFTLPMNQNTFNGQIVKGVADNALNVRVYSLFVQLQLQNTKDFPETIYLKVTHDGDSEFRSYEQGIVRKKTMDTFSMMNKFEVDEKNIEERAEEEMDKNRFCAQDDVITDTLTTCPGLFANYTISVPRGSHACPEVKAGANCRSFNLENSIQAINVFAKIKYQTEKNK